MRKQKVPQQNYQFSSRAVRDLAWVISSPPLVSGVINDVYWWSHEKCESEFNDCLDALIQLDKNPQALINHLSTLKTTRLGLRFEALITYWLMISPNYKLLSKNIQIIENGLTLGEIDFIIEESSTQKIIHLEVAVKFYLGSPPYENTYQWFGTNTKDQLGKKLDHLKQHQTQLSKKYAHHFQYEINQRHCLLKGRLFYPLGNNKSPDGVTQNHLRGLWMYSRKQRNSNYLIPINKLDWLAELNHTDIIKSLNKPEKYLTDRVQCFVKAESNHAHPPKFQESSRVFYLPNDFTFPALV